MSGSSGEKTELPTPKKERDAREKGQVAKSQDVVTTVSLLSVIAYVWVTWDATNARLTTLFDQVAALAVGDFRTNAMAGIAAASWDAVMIMAPILGVVVLSGVAANYFQIGALFSFESISPKLEKISPGAGFKRIFSMKQLVDLLKSIVKIVFLSVLLYLVVLDVIAPYVQSLDCGLPCIGDITVAALGQVLVYSALAFIVVALVDFVYQRHSHTKSLMMTKDEVKREYKESEGDPHIKGKRKQLAHELAMGDGGHAARKGTAVVVNPTHFAVVIRYEPGETPLPLVTAKGRNMQAHYLRAQAEEAGVPIFRNPPLARGLFAEAELYEAIPDEFFDAVAEVLAWVARNKDKLYRERLDHGVIEMDADPHAPAGDPKPGGAGRPGAR
ncbi:type III secretion system export apparatus subunit SctU [Antarcticirhabdus aurantiaca]|uniref:Type III secretion system export apparatus subunit SctU n=1 Tax=Antarcticirhabdus aurantiaca TaxID=2606717 RepID=A0ACD4NUB4_9HYPH|nr:type III secretion system export apparatus subunit SctU [Antarcticirhabdus aurantiaca]WAJ30526.1 type III secretion system export apparatus subunit SctU [Jeongeuplla avenae]